MGRIGYIRLLISLAVFLVHMPASLAQAVAMSCDEYECLVDTFVCDADDADSSLPNTFGDEGMFMRIIQEKGLELSADVSEQDHIVMDEPRLAFANISGMSELPAMKGKVYKGWIEFFDGKAIRFKKPIAISVQGAYSVRYPKKNFTIDFAWDEESGKTETELTIGEWVKQDSYHLKAFYTDVMRGIGEVGYKLYSQMIADRLPFWQRFGIEGKSRARCFPDGFPCIVFLNGRFQGVYAWQLKKSRKNMNMDKHNDQHIHLDGNLSDVSIFGGNITWGQFEVRNPKNLYCMDGSTYNGDRPRELMDESSNYFNNSDDREEKESMQRSAVVKRHIRLLSSYRDELEEIESAGADRDRMREEIEKRYEIESLIDYNVLYHFQYNCDGSLKNWQWFTYDGKKWAVTPYDLDQTFGINLYGVVRPATIPMEPLTSGPFYLIDKYYNDDVRERYCQLRHKGVLEANLINGIIRDWYERVGDDYYSLEEERWPESPCYSDVLCNAGWTVCEEWEKYAKVPSYSSAKTYYAGDIVRHEGRLWQATRMVHGITPYKRNSNIDSVERITGWVASRLDFLDIFYDYDPQVAIDNLYDSDESTARRSLIGIYDSSGRRISHPVRGMNVYRYKDGQTRKIMVK